jgi:hypothetical protein
VSCIYHNGFVRTAKYLLVRVRSHNSWICAGGTKLERINPCSQQIRHPPGIAHIGLAARHILDVRGVGNHQLKS